MVWVWIECGSARADVLKFNPHWEALRQWKLILTLAFKVAAFGSGFD